ncbi:MAG: hypothetical protein WBB43_19320 [Limnoraphis sp.]
MNFRISSGIKMGLITGVLTYSVLASSIPPVAKFVSGAIVGIFYTARMEWESDALIQKKLGLLLAINAIEESNLDSDTKIVAIAHIKMENYKLDCED